MWTRLTFIENKNINATCCLPWYCTSSKHYSLHVFKCLDINVPLLVCGVLNDGFLSVNNMLLQLMGQHAWGECNMTESKGMWFGKLPVQDIRGWLYRVSMWHQLVNEKEGLTLYGWAFEWLGNLVPGFCDLWVLNERERETFNLNCYNSTDGNTTITIPNIFVSQASLKKKRIVYTLVTASLISLVPTQFVLYSQLHHGSWL